MKNLPNILTIGRLVLSLAMFAALVMIGAHVFAPAARWLVGFAVGAFIVAAVTDFFDGWLARRWGVTSLAGAILDPIADKILVCGAIFGLLAVGDGGVLVPGAVILFREFAVSALREVLAPRGIKLPVTFLAKAKTTLQLVALGALMVVWFWPIWGVRIALNDLRMIYQDAVITFYFAALVTVWTGLEYGWAARKALTGRV
jgi:CDP-diacylglycerol--glycerol-3-phosphate 3-phosphatidyltransferase